MRQTRTVAVGAAAVAVAAVIASCSNTAGNDAASTASPAPVQTSASAPAAAAHNPNDMMFARHMIPHHQQAIEMSDMIIAKQGIDPRVVDLAEQIKAAQGPEIDQMQGWIDEWGMPGNMPPHHGDMSGPMMPGMPGMDGMDGMQGMMSPADMQALRDAEGVEASRLFLSQMIRHHEGAITMADNEIQNGQYPEAVELAKAIASTQKQEIDTMNQILQSL